MAHILKQQIYPDWPSDTSSPSQASDLRVLTKPEEIERVRAFWEGHQSFIYADIDFYLYDLANCPNIFQPYVLFLSNNDGPTCLLVARIMEMPLDWRLGYLQVSPRRVRCLDVLHRGLLGNPCEADLIDIAEQLLKPLRTGQADLAIIRSVGTEIPLVQAIRSVALRERYDMIMDELPHWTLHLAGTFEDFLKSRRGKTRQSIRKRFDLIEKALPGNLSIACYRLPSDVPRAARDAETISAKTYQREIGVGLRDTPALRSAWQYAATKQWLRVHVLYLNGEPIAFSQGLVYKNTYFAIFCGYVPTYQDYSPGHYLLLSVLKSFYAEANICIYDFDWGDEFYKMEYSSRCVGEPELYLFAPTLRGRRLKWTKALSSSLNRQSKKGLARLKVLGSTKKYFRRKPQPGHAL